MGMPMQQEQQGWFSDAVNAIESATGIDIDGDGKQAAAAARRQHAPLTTHHSPSFLPTGAVGGGGMWRHPGHARACGGILLLLSTLQRWWS